MLHTLKSNLAEFAESDEVAQILYQMLQVRPPPPRADRRWLRARARCRVVAQAAGLFEQGGWRAPRRPGAARVRGGEGGCA